jgi:hypothetical protein
MAQLKNSPKTVYHYRCEVAVGDDGIVFAYRDPTLDGVSSVSVSPCGQISATLDDALLSCGRLSGTAIEEIRRIKKDNRNEAFWARPILGESQTPELIAMKKIPLTWHGA